MRNIENCVLVGSKLEISSCSYSWMFFTKKKVKQEKKKTSGLKNKWKRKAEESWNLTRVH